jgi:hypothetical protein
VAGWAGVRRSVAVSADAWLFPPEVARMAATPPADARVVVAAAKATARRLRGSLLMKVPDDRHTTDHDER